MEIVGPAAIAIGEVGTKESTNRNDGPVQKYQLDPYNSSYVRRVPWCALFVIWCFDQTGGWPKLHHLRTEWWAFANVLTMWDHWEGCSIIGTPTVNDIVVFDRRGNSDFGPGGHAGIVIGVSNEHVVSVDGNWNNKVSVVTRRLDDPSILGYLRIKP